MPTREAKVDDKGAGERLDRFLSRTWPDYSRSFWQRQIGQGRVLVDDRVETKAGLALSMGQRVHLEFPDEVVPDLDQLAGTERDWPTWVVYHDADLIVINKPRNLVVHPSAGHFEDSVVAQLMPWLPRADGEVRPGVVHRLDKDTTGLMVLARTAQARERLSQAIAQREVTRQYLAVVRGSLQPAEGIIDAPLGRHPKLRLKMAVRLDGRPARTRYRTVAHWMGFSVVQCTLETGRTHQIRVHLASLGHPVVGDVLYGGRSAGFDHGQLLHAGRLRFRHPIRNQAMEFLASVPEDWHRLADWGPADVDRPELYRDVKTPSTAQWLSELGAGGSIRSL